MELQRRMRAALDDDALLEQLAAVEHERWAHWQRYVHDQCVRAEDGSLVIPADLVRRWTRQMATPYEDLGDAEKDSDREQVRRYIPLITDTVIAAIADR